MQGWRINIYARPTDEQHNISDIDVRHPYQEADIQLSSYMFTDRTDIKPWQVTVIHELLHIRTGVYRDHARKALNAIGTKHADAVFEIMAGLEECAVEQAAWAIWRLTKGADDAGKENALHQAPEAVRSIAASRIQ